MSFCLLNTSVLQMFENEAADTNTSQKVELRAQFEQSMHAIVRWVVHDLDFIEQIPSFTRRHANEPMNKTVFPNIL